MRTARPLVTWSRMTLCAPSASSLSISTPRLIGPGCMIRQSGFKSFARCLVRPKRLVYSPSARKILFALTFVLDAEQIDDVGVGSTSSVLCETVTPSCSNSRGTSVLGPTSVTRAPSFSRRKDVRTRDAAEKNVADNRDMETGDRASFFPNRVKIEQGLGRMLVRAIARVDHARLDRLARNCGAPAELCRKTMMSA